MSRRGQTSNPRRNVPVNPRRNVPVNPRVNSQGDESDSNSSDDGMASITAMMEFFSRYFRPPIPHHDSRQQGADWFAEMTHAHDDRFYDAFRMDKDCFFRLHSELCTRGLVDDHDRTRVGSHEALGLFLQIVVLNHRYRDSCEHFQHSSETISNQFHRVLRAINHLAPEIICPRNMELIPSQIMENDKFYPYFQANNLTYSISHYFLIFNKLFSFKLKIFCTFKILYDCVGAIDGTYISANVPLEDQLRYYSRKGHLSQNVMAMCDFDCCFTYIYPGWEGSANDARVLLDAVQNDPKFPVPPPGKYYLVDSCYTNFRWFMSPYRSQRYHLEEFRNREPNGEQELFNQMHAKLRNAIERSFGILKMRFPILCGPMPQFSMTMQIDIVIACCGIHNFIRKFAVNDELFCYHNDDLELERGLTGESRLNATNDEIQLMGDIRDSIAEAMWNDYTA